MVGEDNMFGIAFSFLLCYSEQQQIERIKKDEPIIYEQFQTQRGET